MGAKRRATALDDPGLVDRLEPALRRLIFRYVRDRHVTEDLVQETFLRMFRAFPRYRGRASLTTWAWTIARNLALDHLRSAARSRLRLLECVEAPARHDSGPVDRAETEERRRGVHRALSALSPDARRYLILRAYSDLSYREIARSCGISPTGVGPRLSRAMKKLSRQLG